MRSRKQVSESSRPSMFGTLVASGRRRIEGEAIGSTAGSVVVHAVLIAVLIYATSSPSGASVRDPDPIVIKLHEPPLPDIPAPPADLSGPPASGPALPGFPTIPMPDIVPPSIPAPQPGISIRPEDFIGRQTEQGTGSDSAQPGSGDPGSAPFVSIMSTPPKLRNVDEVQQAVSRNYPGLLRDAGITGTVVMWFYIDEAGRAVKYQVHRSSGYPVLDSAAARVAGVMEFHPARVQDRITAVWVQVPVVFKIQ